MSAALSACLARLADPVTDTELLARFAAARDGDAFAELVRRHGPMVLAVCRRVTRDTHDADDAFQAAFLVLARKADRLGPRDRVAAWLYGVALRAARKACERRGREALVAAVPDVPERTAEPFDPDAARAVVEEVGRLPDIFRAAVVLCELEGRPRAAAARELGVAEGTLSSRLALARKRLAAQLAVRGFGPAALAALVGITVPRDLAARATGGPHPAAVAALAQGVLRTMFLQKLAPVALLVAVAGATGLLAAPQPVPRPAPVGAVAAQDPPRAAPAPKAVPAGPNRLVVWRESALVSLDPTGKNEKTVLPEDVRVHPHMFVVSPDGARVAAAVLERKNRPYDPGKPPWLAIYPVGKGAGAEPDDVGDATVCAWSADGTQLAYCFVTGTQNPNPKDIKTTTTIYTPATKARIPVKLPDNHVFTDWSRDGRFFLTLEIGTEAEAPVAGLWLMNRDGTPVKRLIGPGAPTTIAKGRFSPDGKRVLAVEVKLPEAESPKEKAERDNVGRARPHPLRVLTVFDIAAAKGTPVRDVPLNADVQGFCWSPDGTRIAYTWRGQHPPGTDPATRTDSSLTVCDPDGANQRTVLTATGQTAGGITLGGVDWR